MQAYRVLKQKKEQDDYLIYISLGSTPDSKTTSFISRPFVVNFAVMFSNGSKGLGNCSLTALSLAVVPSRRPKGTAQKKYWPPAWEKNNNERLKQAHKKYEIQIGS